MRCVALEMRRCLNHNGGALGAFLTKWHGRTFVGVGIVDRIAGAAEGVAEVGAADWGAWFWLCLTGTRCWGMMSAVLTSCCCSCKCAAGNSCGVSGIAGSSVVSGVVGVE